MKSLNLKATKVIDSDQVKLKSGSKILNSGITNVNTMRKRLKKDITTQEDPDKIK